MASQQRSWNVKDLLAWTKQFFEKKNIESPRLEAELLLAHVLGWERIQLYTRFDYPMPHDKLAQFKELIIQRSQHRPTQYILGTCEFMSLDFKVNEAVLVPRPETEHLVEALIQRARDRSDMKILDVGTGSGCIPISAAKSLPEAEFWAVDISSAALDVARENAKTHEVDDRIHFLQGDLLEPVAGQMFDFITSNPPYVSRPEWEQLAPEVKEYEPRNALVGGEDGLDVYRRLIPEAEKHLKPNGRLLLELPAEKAEQIRETARQVTEFEIEATIRDYQKIERVLILSTSGEETAQP